MRKTSYSGFEDKQEPNKKEASENPRKRAIGVLILLRWGIKPFFFISAVCSCSTYLVVVGGAVVVVGAEVVVVERTRLVNSGKMDEVVDEAGRVVMFGGAIVFIR